MLIELELKRGGLPCRCVRVDTWDALRAALANEHWDCVLSDYSVPGIYFQEILGYFKRHWPSIPVILVSGTLGDVKAAVMVKLGAREFISKDNLARLAPAIQRQIKHEFI